jgi:hypothetical protein
MMRSLVSHESQSDEIKSDDFVGTCGRPWEIIVIHAVV